MTESFSPSFAPSFFSPIPRAVWDLTAAGRIERRDAALLGALLDYKGRQGTEVCPGQATLARRLGCSVDTIQRGLARLLAACLIAKRRRRDAAGRLRGLWYDLAPVLALMPSKAARLRRGEWGGSQGSPVAKGPAPKPQGCGAEGETLVSEADSTPSPELQPPASDTAQDMARQAGVRVSVAQSLWETFGEARCREQLHRLAYRRVKNRAAALVASIRANWDAPKGCPPPPRPAPIKPNNGEQRPPRPNNGEPERAGGARLSLPVPPLLGARGPVPADPLDALTPAQYAALERDTRAELAAYPEFRAALAGRNGLGAIRSRMRTRLLQGKMQAGRA